MSESKINPWSTIWFNPRETIQRINAENPNQYILLLVCISGIGRTLSAAMMLNGADFLSVLQIFIIAALLGPVSGYISLLIWTWLLKWTSKILGGAANRVEIRSAVAWSLAPFVYLFPLWGVKYILFREELFLLERPFVESHAFLSGLWGLFELVDFVINFWSLFILFSGISEVNKFSIWKSLGAVGLLLLLLFGVSALMLTFFTPILNQM